MNPLNFLSGKKTYVTGAIAVALGVIESLDPTVLPMDVSDPGQMIVMGLGFLFLRKGMSNG